MTETMKRATPSEREHEAHMALIGARKPTPSETITTKENAKGEGLIEALSTSRGDDETMVEWIMRHAEGHMLLAGLIRPDGVK